VRLHLSLVIRKSVAPEVTDAAPIVTGALVVFVMVSVARIGTEPSGVMGNRMTVELRTAPVSEG
jgi:hypothetical protein